MLKYEEIIKELFERHQSVQTSGFNADSYKPGLERMKDIDARMGFPSQAFRSVHVAGTNGKGSVCSMLAASLAAQGYAVGLFTSPHLLDFRERIKIVTENGFDLIGRKDVLEFVAGYDLEGLSFFEVATAMAFWHFARQQVDIAVIEVGLGGLLDSTNILVPELCVVTSIGLDHCALLGGTRAEIASQKAGIFKPGVPALVGASDPETAPVFEAAAAQAHCPLFYADDWPEPELFAMDLRGDCQLMNLRTVLAALELLGEVPDMEALETASSRTGLRGRWETVSAEPLIITDIGHNPPALTQNFAQLEAMMASGKYDKLSIVFGIMADKDLDGIIPLMPDDADYFFATAQTPRARDAGSILARFESARPTLSGRARAYPSVKAATAAATAAATPASLIYVGGSAFVVADFLKMKERDEK